MEALQTAAVSAGWWPQAELEHAPLHSLAVLLHLTAAATVHLTAGVGCGSMRGVVVLRTPVLPTLVLLVLRRQLLRLLLLLVPALLLIPLP